MTELWEIWLDNKERIEKDFANYLKNKKIKIETEIKELVEGHFEKANHNLKFVKAALELKEFNDWAMVGAYYTIYHASLALCALKGYSTKDHFATLLILIKEFYQRQLNREEIEMINKITIEKKDVLYYIEAKDMRTKASYSTQKIFDNDEAKLLQHKAIAFANKVKAIIDSSNI